MHYQIINQLDFIIIPFFEEKSILISDNFFIDAFHYETFIKVFRTTSNEFMLYLKLKMHLNAVAEASDAETEK